MSRKQAKSPHSKFKRLRRWLLILFLAPILFSILAVLLFRFVDPPISGVMVERILTARAAGDKDFRIDHRWCEFKRFGPYLPVAVIASEDQRFIEHFGFDTVEMQRALADAEDGERLRGASTISQQVAKNLFLWSGRSWVRKGLEAWFTLLLEVGWPKKRILEVYLNIAETGEGMFGFCSACPQRFGKSCAEIAPYNLGLLVATLPNPRKWRADKATPYLHRRATWIVRQMQQLGGPQVLQRLEGE